ncbi:WD-repeats-region domain-containing protein [Favolaschia claudopus]|uniref:WD-repeats-region domain-containing protein n=1 Tax=Favolaschia claudopus TaxID=2862362 RepID=A0AAW0BYK4_9AGAR
MSFSRFAYTKHRGVQLHSGLILVLAVTEDGKTLATGGSQGTRLFDTKTMKELKRPAGAGTRGHTSSLHWARQTDEPHDVLYFGTQSGTWACWRRGDDGFEETFSKQITTSGEITGLSFDPSKNILCICSRSDIVQAWKILKNSVNGKWSASSIFSNEIAGLAPRAITFAGFDSSGDRDIVAFGSGHNGPVATLSGSTGKWKGDWMAGGYISSADVDWKEGVLCLNDPYFGPGLFRLADEAKARSFEVPTETEGEPYTTDACFGEKGRLIVAGSDHGIVYVFDARSGETIQKLDTKKSKWVKAVTTAEIGGVPTIFAAHTYRDEGYQDIFVWKRAQSSLIGWYQVEIFLKTLVVLGCVAFIYQNLVSAGMIQKIVFKLPRAIYGK